MIDRKSRIPLQHENSLHSIRGRSAPTVNLKLWFDLGRKTLQIFKRPPTISCSGYSRATNTLLVQILRSVRREHCNLFLADCYLSLDCSSKQLLLSVFQSELGNLSERCVHISRLSSFHAIRQWHYGRVVFLLWKRSNHFPCIRFSVRHATGRQFRFSRRIGCVDVWSLLCERSRSLDQSMQCEPFAGLYEWVPSTWVLSWGFSLSRPRGLQRRIHWAHAQHRQACFSSRSIRWCHSEVSLSPVYFECRTHEAAVHRFSCLLNTGLVGVGVSPYQWNFQNQRTSRKSLIFILL